MHTIIVLTDGETWNTLDGCSICIISNQQFKELCDGSITAGNLLPHVEIGLKEFYGAE